MICLVTALSGLWLAPAHAAPTVAVVVDVQQSPAGLTDEEVRSVVWHALYNQHGHDALVLTSLDDAVEQMLPLHLTTLYDFSVTWQPMTTRVNGRRLLGAHAPAIEVHEYRVQDGALEEYSWWTQQGALSLYRVVDGDTADPEYAAFPEVSLQEAVTGAVSPVRPAAWRQTEHRLRVPIIVAADEEYRAFYGRRWREEATARIERASALLGAAGIELEVVDWQRWHSADQVHELPALLDLLALSPRPDHPGAVRVAFTQQIRTGAAEQVEAEAVGQAYLPGREVIVADQAEVPEHDHGWDEAVEGVAVAHEVLHALGVPHLEGEAFLMSSVQHGAVHRLSARTIALARTAVQARYARWWDRTQALAALEQVATLHLPSDVDQVDYIGGNLRHGPGLPQAGELEAERYSALVNLSLGLEYQRMAFEDPWNADTHLEGALTHARVALRKRPAMAMAQALVSELDPPQVVEPAEVEVVVTSGPVSFEECVLDDELGTCEE